MRLRKTRFKGMLCAILSGAMIMVSVAPASAATARATTMKLEKTEGTVTLKTQNGSARKISNGMRLYNGNTLSTAKYSYAYVNLDDTKAVKLDQSSSATLRQSGNQLELLVKNGKLFFNVSKKLDSKESMNVRTSTMVTGVRGTCGVVEYVDQNKSKLYLIEGKVTLGTGQNATVVQGGQTATVVLQPKQETGGSEQPGGEDKPGETEKPGETDKKMEQKVMVEKLTEKTIPPVALQEIVANPVLQEKIEKTTELKIEKIEEALEQFEKEEAERIEQEKAEQEKEETETDKDKENENKETEQTTTGSGGSSSSSGSSGSGSSGGSVIKEISLSGKVTPGAIEAAFLEYDVVGITENAKLTYGTTDRLTIPGGKQLILSGSQNIQNTPVTVGDEKTSATLKVLSGAMFIAGDIRINNGGLLLNQGALTCNNITLSDSTENAGTWFTNEGVVTGSAIEVGSKSVLNNKETLECTNLSVRVGTDDYFTCVSNYGILTCQTVTSQLRTAVQNWGAFRCTNLETQNTDTSYTTAQKKWAYVYNEKEFCVTTLAKLNNCGYLHNRGVFEGANITGEAKTDCQIYNENLIKLTGALSATDSGATCRYVTGSAINALLISQALSTGMPEGSLLMSAQESTGQAYYYYADRMGANVIENMNNVGAVTWNFAKDAVIPANDNVKLKGFHAQMYDYKLQVEGTLTLSGATHITGFGETTVKLMTGGALNLSDENSSTAAVPTIENTGSGYAIANVGGSMEWADASMILKSKTAGNMLEGVSIGEDNIGKLPTAGYCTLKKDYALQSNEGKTELSLIYLPSEFTTSEDNATAKRLNQAMSIYDTVTVGPNAAVSLKENETVKVSTGKKLIIQSVMNEIEPERYSGGFTMDKNSAIYVKDGGTLEVSGIIMGSGTIGVGTNIAGSKASMVVDAGGRVVAEQLQLNGCLTNSGTIDVGQMFAAGDVSVENKALIKINRAYVVEEESANETRTYTRSYTGSKDSALISNEASTAMPEDTQLAYAYNLTVSGSKSIQQYYYADNLNARVAEYMNQKTASGASITFKKNADISQNTNIALNNFRADMGTNQLLVEGSLTLLNGCEVSGTGDATIKLSGGKLVISSGASDTVCNVIKNAENGYAIARDSGTIVWNDPKAQILSNGGSNYIIQNINISIGVTMSAEALRYSGIETTGDLGCVSKAGFYILKQSEPLSVFENTWVSTADLNRALKYHSQVTIASSSSLTLGNGVPVQIPEGKTLIVKGAINGSGTIMAASTTGNDTNESPACLRVDGYILESDTRSEIHIEGCSVENYGQIKASSITCSEGNTIYNEHYMKIKTFSTAGVDASTVFSSADTGLMICENEWTASITEEAITPLLAILTTESGGSYYFYANCHNPLIRNGVISSSDNDSVSAMKVTSWEFKKDFIVKGDVFYETGNYGGIDFGGARVNLGSNKIVVTSGASLGLLNFEKIESSNTTAVISMEEYSKLSVYLNNSSGSAIINSSTDGMVILVADLSTMAENSIGLGSELLTLQASSADKLVSGIKWNTGGVVTNPTCLQGASDCTMIVESSDGKVVLKQQKTDS